MKPAPKDIDDYLSTCTAGQRAALERLRRTIRAAVPEAVECISYQMPAFRRDGRLFVAFAAALNHCSLFPCSGSLIATHRKELAKYDTSKGTIRFETERPLPETLIRKILKWKMAEGAERAEKSAKSASASRRRRC